MTCGMNNLEIRLKFVVSPDVILCGWLGSNHKLWGSWQDKRDRVWSIGQVFVFIVLCIESCRILSYFVVSVLYYAVVRVLQCAALWWNQRPCTAYKVFGETRCIAFSLNIACWYLAFRKIHAVRADQGIRCCVVSSIYRRYNFYTTFFFLWWIHFAVHSSVL